MNNDEELKQVLQQMAKEEQQQSNVIEDKEQKRINKNNTNYTSIYNNVLLAYLIISIIVFVFCLFIEDLTTKLIACISIIASTFIFLFFSKLLIDILYELKKQNDK